jgi:hypothetical protein
MQKITIVTFADTLSCIGPETKIGVYNPVLSGAAKESDPCLRGDDK